MAEKLFLNSDEKFEDFCDNANDLMQSVTPEARFRWVNRAWLETLGYNEKKIANMTVFDIIHPDELEHCQQLFKEVMSGEDVGRITTAFITKDGNKIIVEGEVNCKFNQGNPIYTRGIFRNITERKQAEEKREQLIQELQETIKEVRTLSGLLPICAWCKKLRDDEGYWKSVEQYIGERTKAEFTHGMCPECFNKYFPENSTEGNGKENNNSEVR